jgi:SRSO17 transposase
MDTVTSQAWSTAQHWGLPDEAAADLAGRLRQMWARFRSCYTTRTRDTSEYAYVYLRGLLTMETDRTFANIARRVQGLDHDGQALQQFMSDSPWVAQAVLRQVQAEVGATPGLAEGGVLLLDESACEKAGRQTAGAGRQRNGRLGTVTMSQVATLLTWTNGTIWTWVDGELFVPEQWFTPEMADLRQRVGLPPERPFATKIELGWQMIQRVQAHGLPFEAVACADFYGRSGWLRHQLDQAGLVYIADIGADTLVYLTPPDFGEQAPTYARRRRHPVQPVPVAQVAHDPATRFQRVVVRPTERGLLDDPFAARRVWTIRAGQVAEEWLVIRHEGSRHYSYALSNAPAATPLPRLAWLKCIRYFVERSIQDAKAGAGWDELQAQKYRAWEHHLALTVLASWFVAHTKHEWAQQYAGDPAVVQQLELEVLPALSIANVRTLLQAALPLPQLSPEEARRLVVTHLLHRARSTRSRLKAQRRQRDPT